MVLPDMLRGACVAQVPPASMVAMTAFVAALGAGVVLRFVYDLMRPLPVGDPREGGRSMLQLCLTIGLAPLIWLTLNFCVQRGWAPEAARLSPWLRRSLGFFGAMLVLRALLRMQISMFPRDIAVTPSIAEVDRRQPVEELEALPAMITLERNEPEPHLMSGSNLPGFAVGALILAVALVGWNMDSLCLFRLPR